MTSRADMTPELLTELYRTAAKTQKDALLTAIEKRARTEGFVWNGKFGGYVRPSESGHDQ